jgi:hypothetical protein
VEILFGVLVALLAILTFKLLIWVACWVIFIKVIFWLFNV